MIASAAFLLILMTAQGAGDYQRPDGGDDLQLICYGDAEKTTVQSHSGYEWDADKHKYMPKSTVETGKTHFDTAVNVSINGDDGHVRLPDSLVPPIHSGDDNGWWRIEDLIVGHNEIRGRFRLNGLNKPTLIINRRSGVMTIDGMIKFSGRCDPDSGHRRF